MPWKSYSLFQGVVQERQKEMSEEAKLTLAGVNNAIIRLIKQEYPIGQCFQKKGSKIIFKVEDLNPCGVVIEYTDPENGNTKLGHAPYKEFFEMMSDLTKVTVAKIEIDETRNPHCWKKMVAIANNACTEYAAKVAGLSGLDLNNPNDRLTVLKKSLEYMNEIYLPRKFPQALCLLTTKQEKIVLFDDHTRQVDYSENHGLTFVRKDEWENKCNGKKALVNKHDLKKIEESIPKKSSGKKISDFKVGDKFVFSSGKYQFIVGETVTITKCDKKGGHVELKSSSDTQFTPIGVLSDDEVRVAIQNGTLIRKTNILTKKLRDAETAEKKLDIILEAAKKIRGDK